MTTMLVVRPLRRKVLIRGEWYTVTITHAGVEFRPYRSRTSWSLPWSVALHRAGEIAANELRSRRAAERLVARARAGRSRWR